MRRMVWCVRTILIAQLAEHGTPVFAPAALVSAAPWPPTFLPVTTVADWIRQRFRQYLLQEGGNPPIAGKATLGDYRVLFALSSNKVGLQTIEPGVRSSEDDNDHYR